MNTALIPAGRNFPIYSGNGKLPKYLQPEEVRKFLEAIPPTKYRDYVLFFTLWGTGLRVSEVIRIRKSNLNFAHRIARVTWLKKRKLTERSIPLHQDVSAQLAQHTSNMRSDALVFPLSRQRVGQLAKQYAAVARLGKNVSPHIFRHSFAVNFLRQTRDIVSLSKLLGHQDLRTTMVYLQLVQKDLADRLAEVTL